MMNFVLFPFFAAPFLCETPLDFAMVITRYQEDLSWVVDKMLVNRTILYNKGPTPVGFPTEYMLENNVGTEIHNRPLRFEGNSGCRFFHTRRSTKTSTTIAHGLIRPPGGFPSCPSAWMCGTCANHQHKLITLELGSQIQ
jgi:hypothetical protein